MISKKTAFLFFIILLVSTMPLPRAEALGMGPPSFELDLQMDGSNSTMVYVTSDGLTGELIVGKETLPFKIEPSRINMSSSDVNVPVELTFYGNETLEPGVYEGKVTFLAYTGGFVAYGIKIRVKINLLGVAQVREDEEEPETPDEEEESEEEPEAETEPESEEESDLPDIDELKDWAEGKQETSEEEESEEEETESEEFESEEENDDESQNVSINPYIMVSVIVAVLAALVLFVWWKRK